MRNRFSELLYKYFIDNKDAYLLVGDLGYSVFDDFRIRFKDRFINVGIAEQNMIGIAAGLLLKNKKVFVYTIANFGILRCFEQIRNDIHYHNLNLKICCVGGGFAYGVQGYTHLGVEDISLMKSLESNIEIFCPSTKKELDKSFNILTNNKKLSYLRLWKNNEPILKYDRTNKYYSQKNKFCENLIVSIGPVAQEVFYLNINYCHINFFRINNIPNHIYKSIFNNNLIKKILFIEEHVEHGSLYYDYLVKKNKLGLKDKIVLNSHFDFKKYNKHGSEKFLRNLFKMDTFNIHKKISS